MTPKSSCFARGLEKKITSKFQKPCLGYFSCSCITPLPQACSRKVAVSLQVFLTTRTNKLRLPMEKNSKTQISPQLTRRGHCQRCLVINTPGKLALNCRIATRPLHSNRGWIFLKIREAACCTGMLLHLMTKMGFSLTTSSLPDSLGIMCTALSCFFASRPPWRFCSLSPNLLGCALLAFWAQQVCGSCSPLIYLWIPPCSPRSAPGEIWLRQAQCWLSSSRITFRSGSSRVQSHTHRLGWY